MPPPVPSPDNREPWLRREIVAAWPEIILIVAIFVGYFAFRSVWMAFHGSDQNYIRYLLTNDFMLRGTAFKGAALGLLLLWLKHRGWQSADLKIRPGIIGTLQGLGLIVAMIIANSTVVLSLYIISYYSQHTSHVFLVYLSEQAQQFKTPGIEVGWLTLTIASLVNAFYEEVTCLAYAFNQFAAKCGPMFALLVIVALRAACHTYQGPIHAAGIAAAFLVSGAAYWYTRNLWPILVAHAIADLGSLGVMKLINLHH